MSTEALQSNVPRKPDSWDRIFSILVILGTVVLAIGAWEGIVRFFDIPQYVIPKPADFLWRFHSDSAALLRHGLATAYAVLAAFALSIVVGVPLAYLFVRSAAVEEGAYPLLVFFQIIPKTITAPLFVVWFGIGFLPKLVLTTVMTFFPVLVDSMAGFRSVDPRLYHLTRSMGASRWQTFRYLELPSALPHIFSGLKIATVYAVTAAISVEFIGSNEGLGFLIVEASGLMDLPLMFAAILSTAVLGLVFSLGISSLEHLFMPWLRRDR